jgi:hypothetical protein
VSVEHKGRSEEFQEAVVLEWLSICLMSHPFFAVLQT